MKKSKVITIGLLALSIAGCHKKRGHNYGNSWNQDPYISTNGGGSYNQGSSGMPFWFYYMLFYNRGGGGYGYYPGAVYYHSNHYGAYRMGVSERGVSYRAPRGAMRGGFGRIGRVGGIGA